MKTNKASQSAEAAAAHAARDARRGRMPATHGTRESYLLELQQLAGNQAVQQFLLARAVQTRLTISQPGDPYEEEADRVANELMRKPCPECQDAMQADDAAGERVVRPKRQSPGPEPVGSDVEAQLQQAKGGGRPLTEPARAFFETRFGHDFGDVRVHTDDRAVALSRDLHASAFTAGRDIYFGSGQYDPETFRGRQLLAHELAHVIQQGHTGTIDGIQRKPVGNRREATVQVKWIDDDVEFYHRVIAAVDAAQTFKGVGEPDLLQPLRDPTLRLFTRLSRRAEPPKAGELVTLRVAALVNPAAPHARVTETSVEEAPAKAVVAAPTKPVKEEPSKRVTKEPEAPIEEPLQFTYDAGLNRELVRRFNRMVIAMKEKGVTFDKIDGVRPVKRSHILSTAYHIRERKSVTLEELQSLPDGKDQDGNVWYMKDFEKGGASREQILKKAAKNALDVVIGEVGEGSRFVTKGKINCAYEGYDFEDDRRFPNTPAVPVSSHVRGTAIDLGGINWEPLGGAWSPTARKFVASFGLTRPFSPDTKAYCIDEPWHFELAPETPEKTGAPSGAKGH